MEPAYSDQSSPLFNNPFQIEDLQIFDDKTWHRMLETNSFGLKIPDLALSLQGANPALLERTLRQLPSSEIKAFLQAFQRSTLTQDIKAARSRILDKLFWELTYCKTPELYEELTEGEKIHPGIFQNLKSELEGKVILDAGSGSGRASFECLRYGASRVYAIEPSRGLLKILRYKLNKQNLPGRIIARYGTFDNLPLGDQSVDIALACSSFTADAEQGGEKGLEELLRVTRPSGKVIIIWPRQQDLEWLRKRGFQHVVMPLQTEMKVYFRSMKIALRCAKRFYQRNPAVKAYLQEYKKPEVPFSVLGFNPPRDYCWRKVEL